jgi:hypothetical protein
MSRTRPTRSASTHADEADESRVLPSGAFTPRSTHRALGRAAKIERLARLQRRHPALLEQPALTEREERVRRVLLKELGGLNSKGGLGGSGLSYAENKRLVQSLDPDFLERELEKLRKRLDKTRRWKPYVVAGLLLFGAAYGGIGFYTGRPIWNVLLNASIFWMHLWTLHQTEVATQRRYRIYQALHALSGADERDVILSRATHDADWLIGEVTRRTLGKNDPVW